MIILLYLSRGLPTAVVQDGERIFFDPSGNKQVPFPSLFDEPTKELSIVIPAYNEQERLPVCLDEMLNWLTLRNKADPKFTFEIILVDDGSKDGTASVGYDYAKKFGSDAMRVLRVLPNGGKGNAVKKVHTGFCRISVDAADVLLLLLLLLCVLLCVKWCM